MKKIFLAILLLGSIVPVSQFHAKTDELICLHEPDSWFKKKLNSFKALWGKIKASPLNSSHEVLRVEGYDQVRGYTDDVFSTDDRDAKDQFKIDCYQRGDGKVKGNVVLDKDRKTTDKLDDTKINTLKKEKQKRIDRQAAAKKPFHIDFWTEKVSKLLGGIEELKRKSRDFSKELTKLTLEELPLTSLSEESKKHIHNLLTELFKGVDIPKLDAYLDNYFKDAQDKNTAAYQILGFAKNEPDNTVVTTRYGQLLDYLMRIGTLDTYQSEKLRSLTKIIDEAANQLKIHRHGTLQ